MCVCLYVCVCVFVYECMRERVLVCVYVYVNAFVCVRVQLIDKTLSLHICIALLLDDED